MKIAVCIKQVPFISLVRFDNETRRVVREDVPNEVNPFDVLGMSLAVGLKEALGGEVVAYTMGPPQAREALVQCLAMGADRAVHLVDPEFAGSDTLATARTLALALKDEAYDLVICGRNSVDAETSQVGPELAEMLGLPQVTTVRRIEFNDRSEGFTAERLTDSGYDRVHCSLPALITVTEEVAPEIYPSREQMEEAQLRSVTEISASGLANGKAWFGADGSPTWVGEVYSFEPDRAQIILRDKPVQESVDELVKYLEDRRLLDDASKTESKASVSRGPLRQRGANGPIWVVGELAGESLRPITLELLGRACELADYLHTCVEALLIGGEPEIHAETLAAYGADRVLLAKDPSLRGYDTDKYTEVLAEAISRENPYAVILPSTIAGRDLAARVAARLELGLTGDCIGLEVDTEGRLVQLKPAFGGNIVAPIYSKTSPQMATVRPGLMSVANPDWAMQPVVDYLPIGPAKEPRVRLLESVIDESVEGAEIESARRIVAVGKGIGGPDSLGLIKALAQALGASIGATREVTDLGWLPRQHQIGLSGKSVSPELYVAIGVRGVFNHTVGIQKSGTVVAINNSARSPIFKASDIGILGDYQEVVPVLTKALVNRR